MLEQLNKEAKEHKGHYAMTLAMKVSNSARAVPYNCWLFL